MIVLAGLSLALCLHPALAPAQSTSKNPTTMRNDVSVKQTETETLAALARLYGVVRWFHPADAAQEIDWNRFAVYAAKSVRAAHSAEDLDRALEDLFSPLAVGLTIGKELPVATPREVSAGTKLVGWQHLGLGFGARRGGGDTYRSVRTHRHVPVAIDGLAVFAQVIPIADLGGKTVRLTAQVKAHSATADGAALLWVAVHRGEKTLDNIPNHPIGTPEWHEYATEAVVDADGGLLAFGVLARGAVRAGFDAVRLSVRETDGSWRELPIEDPGFEDEHGWRRAGNSLRAAILYRQDAPPEGRQWLEISPPQESGALFEAPLRAGAHATFDLGRGLQARVPLVLTDVEAKVTPEQQRRLDALKAEIAGLPEPLEPSDADVRAADVIVAWSVFRHFYPYWAEVGLDWDARLRPLLDAAAAPASRDAHRDSLRRLVAEVRDGHGWVSDGRDRRKMMCLPISTRWVDDRVVVTASAVPEQVRVGDVVTAIDGRPAGEWCADHDRLEPGSSYYQRAQSASGTLLWGVEGSRVMLELDRDGRSNKIELTRDRAEQVPESRPEPLTEIRPGIFYVDLKRAQVAAVQGRIAELARARAVVFDMRGYPRTGMQVLLPHLLAAPERDRWMYLPQITEPFGRIGGWGAGGWDVVPGTPRITGKVAFLVDDRAVSFGDTLIGYVEAFQLGAIVGSATTGTNGDTNDFGLPCGMDIRFSGTRVTRHDGSRAHLVGVQPTIPVEPTVAGLRAGRDEVLERGLEAVGAEGVTHP